MATSGLWEGRATKAFRDHGRVRVIVIIAAVFILYIPPRLYLLLCFHPVGSDVELYARYAYVHRLAKEKGEPFHDLYRSMGFAEIRRNGVKWFDSTLLTTVCYPSLAIGFANIPAMFIKAGSSASPMSLEDFTVRYQMKYRWLCALFELIGAVMVSMLIFGLYKNDDLITTMFRMGILCLAGCCLPFALYDRLDIILSALLAISLVVLLKKKPLLSFVIFSFAVAYKIIPVFLLPVWVLGSFNGSNFQQVSFRDRVTNLFRQGILRGILLCGMIAGIFAVFYWIEGRGSLDFIGFHSNRGVHIESMWGTLSLLAARMSGAPFHIVNSYGALDVVMPSMRAVQALSMPVLLLLLTGLTSILVLRCIKKLGQPLDKDSALLNPQSVIEAALLFFCVVFSCSRIFSPQYLLVLVPLVSLLSLAGRGEFTAACAFVLCCCFSTLIYPYFFEYAIVVGPTWFGLYLLTTRTLLLLGITGFYFARGLAALKNE